MDIVDRLKEAAKQSDMGRKTNSKSILRQAAKEIETLRKALKPMTTGTYWINQVDVKRARKVLHLEEL